MKRSLCMLLATSTLTLFLMLFVGQTHAEKVRSPCVLTSSERALVNGLMRFHKSSYFTNQANIKKCIMFGATTILVYYHNGHIGLFGTGVSDVSQGLYDPYIKNKGAEETSHTNKEAQNIFYEFTGIWRGADSPNELSPENLAHADALVPKFLSIMSESDQSIVPIFGSRGNRYLALIEGHHSLPLDVLLFFYSAYLGTSDGDFYVRTEDMPTHDNKQVVVKKIVNILETAELPDSVFHSVYISRQIKKFDPDSYGRLVAYELIIESNE